MDKKNYIAAFALTAGVLMYVGCLRPDVSKSEPTYAQGEYVASLEGIESPFVQVAERVIPCVVGVSNQANTYSIVSGRTETIEQATGSGVVITTQGHVVTNFHVIEGAANVQVLWQGRYLEAEIIGVDELTDLAVLRVAEDVVLPAVRMGDPQSVKAGDWAIAIGNPLGDQFANTVTVGVISATGREIKDSPIVKMIQTDAAINSGNSGGGLFNTKGELIGIPSLKFSTSGRAGIASIEGIAMAIPIDVVEPVVNHLIRYGKVTRPKLGVTVMTLRGSEKPTEGSIPSGVYVSAVSNGSAAQEAGIKPDDIITHADGKRIMLHTDLTNCIAAKSVGESIMLTIYRIENLSELTVQDRIPKGETLEIEVKLTSSDEWT